ncbi:hypothetical protein [Streptomyces sp. CAU 1734]|uniref:hypothetical protein n=1 Tax=Streptomyces sp. CAU 1734 TaxID=3140360 RepID=UPI0032616BD5
MTRTVRRLTMTATAVTAALLLSSCTSSETKPLEHGTVKEKNHDPAYTTPVYKKQYRETNCRNDTTNMLTLSAGEQLQGKSSGGTGGRSSSNKGGKSKKSSRNEVDPGTANGGSGGRGGSRRVCDREYLGRVKTGERKHPEVWEVLITKGDRSRWLPVSEERWNEITVGDDI